MDSDYKMRRECESLHRHVLIPATFLRRQESTSADGGAVDSCFCRKDTVPVSGRQGECVFSESLNLKLAQSDGPGKIESRKLFSHISLSSHGANTTTGNKTMKENVVKQKMGTVSLIMIITSIVIAGGFGFYDYILERARMKADFQEMIVPVSGRLAENLAKPIWFRDEPQARHIIGTEMENKRIYAVVVRESDETFLLGMKRNGTWEPVESEGDISGDFIIEKKGMNYEEADEPIGNVEIFFTFRFMDETLDKLIIYIGIKVLVMSILLVSVLLFIVNRFFIRPVSKAIRSLEAVETRVSQVSDRMAAVGWQLTLGTSRQASAVEETSASMEQSTSMVRQNTENVGHANRLMNETSRVVKDVADSMRELTVSIDDISKTSEETRKVIVTIEDIAFQINLLALNAAVEAARAGGKTGAGFAVVAQEVRNLAMRSSQIAKNTAALIETSIEKTKSGIDLIYKAGQAFTDVAAGAKKVGNLLSEVTASSEEYVQVITHVSQAMNDIYRVTQVNAANAEETASVIGEMEGQVKFMEGVVRKLAKLVGSESRGSSLGRKRNRFHPQHDWQS